MTINDIIYLLFLSVVLALSCYPIARLLHYFFSSTMRPVSAARWLKSGGMILALSLAVYAISMSIEDIETGNRIIHAFGGGFLAYMACYLAARDTGLHVSKIRFFIFCFMLVMTLGIFNEVVEYVMQNHFHFTAAPNVNDTWLDLISNIVGTLIAAIWLTPRLRSK